MADSPLNALQPGFELQGYRLEDVLGTGGFGITYRARELLIGRVVAVKEYLPAAIALRGRDGVSVHPGGPGKREAFDWGLRRFRKEAQALVNFRHPNVVDVYRLFEANGTAYLVMAFEEGMSLGALLKRHGPITESEIREVLDPLLDGVALIHRSGFLHRDIKPDNIIIRRDGTPVLIDFGAVRSALGLDESGSSQAIVSPGYSPFEQYAAATPQAAPTDIYSLGATAYACITGHRPIDAPDRLAGTRMMPAVEAGQGRYGRALLAAVDEALAVMPDDRPQSIEAWRALIDRGTVAPAVAAAGAVPERPETATVTKPMARAAPARAAPARAGGFARRLALALLAVAVIATGVFFALRATGDWLPVGDPWFGMTDPKGPATDPAAAERARKEDAARRQAEVQAARARDVQRRTAAVLQRAQDAVKAAAAAAETARAAAASAREERPGHYAGPIGSGDRYEGQFHLATRKFQGYGVYVHAGGMRYEGMWNEGDKEGSGVQVFANGDRYEGGFKDSRFEGHGTYIWAGGARYEGRFDDDKRQGLGVTTQPNGDRHEGEYRNNEAMGLGVLVTAAGARYEGQVEHGLRHGLGVERLPDGTVRTGRWFQGEYLGVE